MSSVEIILKSKGELEVKLRAAKMPDGTREPCESPDETILDKERDMGYHSSYPTLTTFCELRMVSLDYSSLKVLTS